MNNCKKEIARQLIQLNHGTHGIFSDTLRNIDDAVQWAWDNWDESIVSTYYAGEKPSRPTQAFIEQWVDNEDFEADGYDINHLRELFG